MGGEIQQLKQLIEERLVAQSRVSLVGVIAAFDRQNHLLPSTWRLNKAIAQTGQPFTISADGLHLELCSSPKPVELSYAQLAYIVDAYLRSIRSPRPSCVA